MMKLFRATLVLWLIAILREVSGEAGKSLHQTTERCFILSMNLLIMFNKQSVRQVLPRYTTLMRKPLKRPSQTKFIRNMFLHFSAIVLRRGVATINCCMASVNPELRATLTKRLKQSPTSPCHTFERYVSYSC